MYARRAARAASVADAHLTRAHVLWASLRGASYATIGIAAWVATPPWTTLAVGLAYLAIALRFVAFVMLRRIGPSVAPAT